MPVLGSACNPRPVEREPNPQDVLCRCVVLVLSLRLARLGSVEPLTWRLVRAWLPVNLLCAPRMS